MSTTPYKWTGRPTCYVLIGPPASGKSTWTKAHLETAATRTHVASTDDILEEIAAEQGISYAEAWKLHFKTAERLYKAGLLDAVRDGLDIIVDRTNLTPKARAKIQAYLRSNAGAGYRTVGVHFIVGERVLRERLDRRFAETGKFIGWDVVERMMGTAIDPSKDEFDSLIEIVN